MLKVFFIFPKIDPIFLRATGNSFGPKNKIAIMGDLAKGIKSFKKGMSDDSPSGSDSPNKDSDNSNSENK